MQTNVTYINQFIYEYSNSKVKVLNLICGHLAIKHEGNDLLASSKAVKISLDFKDKNIDSGKIGYADFIYAN